eukprot:12212537-Alexandrium_andersonii.AAC.1
MGLADALGASGAGASLLRPLSATSGAASLPLLLLAGRTGSSLQGRLHNTRHERRKRRSFD